MNESRSVELKYKRNGWVLLEMRFDYFNVSVQGVCGGGGKGSVRVLPAIFLRLHFESNYIKNNLFEI